MKAVLQKEVGLFVSQLSMKNMVVSVKFSKRYRLLNLPSNKDILYNCELFPAALIQRWRPAHVSLFHTGSAIITGIQSLEQAKHIMSEMDTYMTSLSHPSL